jgi:hypothetical protein
MLAEIIFSLLVFFDVILFIRLVRNELPTARDHSRVSSDLPSGEGLVRR